MGSIRNIRTSSVVPDDFAKRLSPCGVQEILDILWQGYNDLLGDKSILITERSEEDNITQELYGKISLRWTSENRATKLCLNSVGPVHQYQDSAQQKCRGHKPTIDFCFRDWATSNSYFGVECKNLYKNRKSIIKRYVDTGVENYTTGRYGSQSSESSLIGYVLSGNVFDIVTEIISEVATTSPVSNLSRVAQCAAPQYVSIHNRPNGYTRLTLHHLFFDFSF